MTEIFSFLENRSVSFSINPVLRPSMAYLPTFCDVHATLLFCFISLFFYVQWVWFDQFCSTHLYVNILCFLSSVQDVNINTVPLLCFCLSFSPFITLGPSSFRFEKGSIHFVCHLQYLLLCNVMLGLKVSLFLWNSNPYQSTVCQFISSALDLGGKWSKT